MTDKKQQILLKAFGLACGELEEITDIPKEQWGANLVYEAEEDLDNLPVDNLIH